MQVVAHSFESKQLNHTWLLLPAAAGNAWEADRSVARATAAPAATDPAVTAADAAETAAFAARRSVPRDGSKNSRAAGGAGCASTATLAIRDGGPGSWGRRVGGLRAPGVCRGSGQEDADVVEGVTESAPFKAFQKFLVGHLLECPCIPSGVVDHTTDAIVVVEGSNATGPVGKKALVGNVA